MTFEIPSNKFESFEKRLNSLIAKARAFGNEFTYEKLGTKSREVSYNGETIRYEVTIVELSGEVKLADYEVVAKVEDIKREENLINMVSTNKDYLYVLEEYRGTPLRCDHCHSNRRRKVSYLVKDLKSGDMLMVGSGCLKDYTGISLEGVGAVNSLIAFLEKSSKIDGEALAHSEAREYDVDSLLALFYREAELHPYFNVIKEWKIKELTKGFLTMTNEEIDNLRIKNMDGIEADKIWALTKSIDQSYNEYACNAGAVIRSGYVTLKNAYAIAQVHHMRLHEEREVKRAEELKALEAKRAEEERIRKELQAMKKNEFMGRVDGSIKFRAKVKYVAEFNSYFGYRAQTCHVFIFETPDGNTAKWFSTKHIMDGTKTLPFRGDAWEVEVEGKVKRHEVSEYKDEKTNVTVLKNCNIKVLSVA